LRSRARALGQVLGISRDLGHPGGEVRAFNKRGTLHRVSADHAAGREVPPADPDLARTIAIGTPGRRFLRVVLHVQQAAMLLGLTASHLTGHTLKAPLVKGVS